MTALKWILVVIFVIPVAVASVGILKRLIEDIDKK